MPSGAAPLASYGVQRQQGTLALQMPILVWSGVLSARQGPYGRRKDSLKPAAVERAALQATHLLLCAGNAGPVLRC